MRPRILVIGGALNGTVQQLPDTPVTIGRDDSNILCLSEDGVSRRHCRIACAGDEYQVVDLGSRNGTFVNGMPVIRRTLTHGDTIRIADSELVFLTHESAEGPHPPIHLNDSVSADTINVVAWDRSDPPPTFETEVGRMARDLNALCKISVALNTIRDLDLFQAEVLKLILEVVPASQGAILLPEGVDIEAGSICTWSRESGGGQGVDVQSELVQRALWEGAAVLANAPATQSAKDHVLCVPLIAVERTLGVIYLLAPQQHPGFREDHAYFLESVSRIAAITLENITALEALRTENRRLQGELSQISLMVGESQPMKLLGEMILRLAPTESTVLILGESGTGKELVARSLHGQSTRRDRPFIAINCAAIPEALLESELFGHDKGAFTGAVGTRKGKLEAAEDGTLFLDEIGELPPAMQSKLLRVLQQKEFERLGANRTLPLRARVLAATNKDLQASIKSGEFRQDLYYRLNVISLRVPPLRERREDIPLLALFFATKYAKVNKRPFRGISPKARDLLEGYNWPGNIRELENAIEHAVVLGLTEEILPEDLPDSILEEQSAVLSGARYHDVITRTKKELVEVSLKEARGNFPDAARILGIHPKYLHRLVRNLTINRNPSEGK